MFKTYSFKLLVLCGIPTMAVALLVSYALWSKRRDNNPSPPQSSPDHNNNSSDNTSLQQSPDSSSLSKQEEKDQQQREVKETNGDNNNTVDSPQSIHITNNIQSDSGFIDQSTPLREAILDVATTTGGTVSASSQPPTQTPPIDSVPIRGGRARATIHLPLDIVGRFIGRQGRNIKSLMAESGAQIHVQQKNISKESSTVPCIVQGTQSQIASAIDLVISRHPEVPFPTHYSSFPPLYPPPPPGVIGTGRTSHDKDDTYSWDCILENAIKPSGVFPAIVTYIESLSRIWLVPYTSTQLLESLHQQMNKSYSNNKEKENEKEEESKNGENTFSVLGKFCGVRVSKEYWLRGRVIKESEEKSYEVQLMDYGSSVIVPLSSIKPLKKEHTLLKMQAFPCQLANIEPNSSNSEDGMLVLQALVEGTVLEVHLVSSNAEEGELPVVELYIPAHFGSEGQAFINRELVNQGFAVWKESTSKATPTGQTTPIWQATPSLTCENMERESSFNKNQTDPILELLTVNNQEKENISDNPLIRDGGEEKGKALSEPLLNLLTSNATPTSVSSLMVSH